MHWYVLFMDFVLVLRKPKSRESHASTVHARRTLGRVASDMENANIAFSVWLKARMLRWLALLQKNNQNGSTLSAVKESQSKATSRAPKCHTKSGSVDHSASGLWCVWTWWTQCSVFVGLFYAREFSHPSWNWWVGLKRQVFTFPHSLKYFWELVLAPGVNEQVNRKLSGKKTNVRRLC